MNFDGDEGFGEKIYFGCQIEKLRIPVPHALVGTTRVQGGAMTN